VFVCPRVDEPFIRAVKGLRPLRRPFHPHAPRQGNQHYLPRHLPRLCQEAVPHVGRDHRRPLDPGASSGSGGSSASGFPGAAAGGYSATGGSGNAGDDLEADTWIVDWSKENQAYFQNVRLNWSHMPDEAPRRCKCCTRKKTCGAASFAGNYSQTNGDAIRGTMRPFAASSTFGWDPTRSTAPARS